jgi:hypothetical protein
MVLAFFMVVRRVELSFVMLKRLTVLCGVLALGLVLGGCTRCGWIWDQSNQPASCRSDAPQPAGMAMPLLSALDLERH